MCRKQVRDPNLAKEMGFNGDPGPSSSRASRIRTNIGGDEEHRMFYDNRLFGVDDVGLY